MKADFELFEDGTVGEPRGPGRGGARPNSGPKPPGYVKPQETKDYEIARARKEAALADMHELQFKIKSGEYVSRTAVREATATLLSNLAQSLRSLPDNLERKYSLPPEVVSAIERDVDGTLSDISEGLAMFTSETVG
jgi:phage terminase Nu1 subunit (DNA packaging protein)